MQINLIRINFNPNAGGNPDGPGPSVGEAVLDFGTIGYTEVPKYLSDDLAYTQSVYDRWCNYGIPSISDQTIVYAPFIDTSYRTSFDTAFYNYTKLVHVPLYDTSNATNFRNMFERCTSLKEVPLLDTSKGTDMYGMFSNCSGLTEIPPLDTSNVGNMERMFYGCSSLEEVPLLDTSKVTDMTNLFCSCSKLTTVPHFNTSRVENMTSMFNTCRTLKTIPQFDTKQVSTMDRMFYMCDALESVPALDMGNIEWNQQYLYVMSSMNNLTYIGGFPNMVASWDNNYGLCKCPNLTKESCLDILNSLVNFYDEWGEEPDWDGGYGVLKVHKNFLNHVGDDISIAIDKGWNVTV